MRLKIACTRGNASLFALMSAYVIALVLMALVGGSAAAPFIVYMRDPRIASSDYRRTPTLLFPQTRLFSDFGDADPQYVLPSSSDSLGEVIAKRNIAIGRGDGFRPGRR